MGPSHTRGPPHHQPTTALCWPAVSLLLMDALPNLLAHAGDSRLLLPAALLLLLAAKPIPSNIRLRWSLAIAVTGVIVLTSKLLFLGWGIGIRALDFTGFSGHAAMSAALWPVLLGLALAHRPSGCTIGAGVGLALAAAIAWSRVPIGAHSWSEVISGVLLGATATWYSLRTTPTRLPRSVTPWVIIALLLGALVPLALPDLRTHDVVVHLATWLSGREHPFHR